MTGRHLRHFLPQLLRALAGVFIIDIAGTPVVAVATETVGPIEISIPKGFVQAQSQHQGALEVSAWTRSTPTGTTKSLLQVTIYDFGSQLDGASPQDLAKGSEKYLREYLSGVEHRRTDYLLSQIEHLKLAGLPAARATWTGRVDGTPSVGVMYCVIVQKQFVVSFHTQDLGNAPTDAMRQAMKSIEAVRITAPHLPSAGDSAR